MSLPYILSSQTEKARHFEQIISSMPKGKLLSSKFIKERMIISTKCMSRYFQELEDKKIISRFNIKNKLITYVKN